MLGEQQPLCDDKVVIKSSWWFLYAKFGANWNVFMNLYHIYYSQAEAELHNEEYYIPKERGQTKILYSCRFPWRGIPPHPTPTPKPYMENNEYFLHNFFK